MDQAWVFSDQKKHPVLCLLIPLMVKSEYLSFIESLDAFFKDRFGHNIEQAGAVFYYREISENKKFFDYLSFIADHTKESTCSLPSNDFIFQYVKKIANSNFEDQKKQSDIVNNFKCLEKNNPVENLLSINFSK